MLKYCNRDFYETLVKMKSFVHSDQECFTQRHSGWICSEISKCPLSAQNGDSCYELNKKTQLNRLLLSKLEPAIGHRHSNFFFSQNGPVRFLGSFKKKSYLSGFDSTEGNLEIARSLYTSLKKKNF